MASEAPPFWWEKPDWRSLALSPLSLAYGAVARRQLRKGRRQKIDAPVLCVGNFTVGGSGKTPVAIALAGQARAAGLKPGILSRGHGGSFSEPHVVDAAHDAAKHVGDEPLLLAAHAPVAVSPNRAAAAAHDHARASARTPGRAVGRGVPPDTDEEMAASPSPLKSQSQTHDQP